MSPWLSDYTHAQTKVIPHFHEISADVSHAESQFAQAFYLVEHNVPERPPDIHVVARGIDRREREYTFSWERWQRVLDYPDDRHTFYIVDLILQRAIKEGWMWHEDILRVATRRRFSDGVKRIVSAVHLEPPDTFCPWSFLDPSYTL